MLFANCKVEPWWFKFWEYMISLLSLILKFALKFEKLTNRASKFSYEVSKTELYNWRALIWFSLLGIHPIKFVKKEIIREFDADLSSWLLTPYFEWGAQNLIKSLKLTPSLSTKLFRPCISQSNDSGFGRIELSPNRLSSIDM